MVPPLVMEQMKQVFDRAESYVIYGCTEISCMGCSYRLERTVNESRCYVGRPFPGVIAHVFDGDRNIMPFGAVGEIVASGDPGFKPGDLVQSGFGWREGFNAAAGTVQKLDPMGLPPQAFLGAAGMPGLTAYVGLLKIAALKDGDVVFVSAAAGAVGQVVCQIAKIKGHTVIGSAGGPEKVAFLKSIGVDHVID